MRATRRRSRRSRAPVVTLLLVAATFFVFAFELAGDGPTICQTLGFVPAHPAASAVLTYAFVHDPANWLHIGGNAAFLLAFGLVVERELGSFPFTAIYFASGVAGAMMHAVVTPEATVPLVGCSGAVFGLLPAVTMLRPKMVGFTVSYVAFNIVSLFIGAGGAVSFGAHLGGFAAGFLVTLLFARLAGDVRVAVPIAHRSTLRSLRGSPVCASKP